MIAKEAATAEDAVMAVVAGESLKNLPREVYEKRSELPLKKFKIYIF